MKVKASSVTVQYSIHIIAQIALHMADMFNQTEHQLDFSVKHTAMLELMLQTSFSDDYFNVLLIKKKKKTSD